VARINDENLPALLFRGGWILLLALVLVSLPFAHRSFTVGVLTGGLLSLANFTWLRSILARALNLEARQAARFAQLRYLFRLTLQGVAIYLLIAVWGVDVYGLLLGLSVLVLNIMAVAVYLAANRSGG
jgi:hypothetical protein